MFFHTGKSHLICTFRLITIICTVSGRKGIPFCMIQVHLHCHFTFNLALSYFDMDSSRSLSRFFKSNCNFTFSFSFWFASVYVQQKAYINNNENKILHKSGFICIRDVNIFDMFFVYLYFWQPVFCFGDFLFILYFFFKPLFLTVLQVCLQILNDYTVKQHFARMVLIFFNNKWKQKWMIALILLKPNGVSLSFAQQHLISEFIYLSYFIYSHWFQPYYQRRLQI